MQNDKMTDKFPKSLDSFARGLLATTCLTVACGGSAVASTITEGSGGVPIFPDTPNGYLLPTGTTVVTGFIPLTEEGGHEQWFEFQSLTPSGSYTLTGQTSFTEAGIGMDLFDDSLSPGNPPGNLLGESALENGSGTHGVINFTAPADGNVVVDMFLFGEGDKGNFTDTLTQNSGTVPEPATFGGAALGLGAIALAWRRRRAQ